jgi:hypothetical protein
MISYWVDLKCPNMKILSYFHEILYDPFKLFSPVFKGPLTEWADENKIQIFSTRDICAFMEKYWQIPFFATFIYIIMLITLPKFMKTRDSFKFKNILFWWNFSLSLFSFIGVLIVTPCLFFNPLAGFITKGFYESVCSHPDWFGNGYTGLFICYFVFSKIPESSRTFIYSFNSISSKTYCV